MRPLATEGGSQILDPDPQISLWLPGNSNKVRSSIYVVVTLGITGGVRHIFHVSEVGVNTFFARLMKFRLTRFKG